VSTDLLRIRVFRRIAIARGVASLSNWGVILASSYLVLLVTDNPLAVGALAVAKGLPSLLLTSFGGALADRYSMTRVIGVAYGVRSLAIGILAVLFWSGAVNVWVIYAITVVAGCSAALAKASVAALVVQPIPRELHQRAVVVSSLVYSVGAIVGPVIAGTLLAFGGIGTAYLVSAVGLLAVSALTLLGIRITRGVDTRSESASPEATSVDSPGWWASVRMGLSDPLLRPAFVGIALLGIAVFPIMSLAAVIADEYGSSPVLLEVILAAAGFGSLASNAVLMKVDVSRYSRLRVLAVGFIAIALATALAASAWSIVVEAVAFALVAGAANLVWVVTSSAIQSDSPVHLRGRMNGVFYTVASGGTAVGALVMAESMNLVGVSPTLVGYAVAVFGAGLLMGLRIRRWSRG
jgi:MFS family permease